MHIERGWKLYTFLIPTMILILIFFLTVQKTEGISSSVYEAPIYKMSFSENIQRDIWELCEKNHLSYELVLAIFHIEGDNNTQIEHIKVEIEKLVYLRDHWAKQGYSDEFVFDLMLLSRQRGIEGCIKFIKDNGANYSDNYVQRVTEYKYYLEQREYNNSNNEEWADDGI